MGEDEAVLELELAPALLARGAAKNSLTSAAICLPFPTPAPSPRKNPLLDPSGSLSFPVNLIIA